MATNTADAAARRLILTQGGTSANVQLPVNVANKLTDLDVSDLATQIGAALTAISSTTTCSSGNIFTA